MIALGTVLGVAIAVVAAPTTAPPTTAPPDVPAPPLQLELHVSQTEGLDPDGDTVTVTGSGYDESRGIYVAFCVVPPPGQTPTPCGGGIDLKGESGSSHWISSSPPDYGVGLAEPYGPGGSFSVEIGLSAMLNADVDCRQVQCAVVTRADHTRLADRSLDVIVPVFFAATPVSTSPAATSPVLTLPPLPDAAATAPTAPGAATGATVAIDDSATAEQAIETMGPSRGAAATWPVWVGTAIAAVGLAVAAPKRRRAKGERG